MPGIKRVRKNSTSGDCHSTEKEVSIKDKGQKTTNPAAQSAQKRRTNEVLLMTSLAEALPVPKKLSSRLDKATILRMAIGYLKMKNILKTGKENSKTFHGNVKEAELMLKALHGFVMFVSLKGDVFYVSEQIIQHTGFNPEDMIGNSIYNFLHPDDCKEFYRQLRSHPVCNEDACQYPSVTLPNGNGFSYLDRNYDCEEDDEVDEHCYVCERLFYARMKCHIKKRGLKTKQTGFMLMQFSGRIKLENRRVIGITVTGRPMQSTPIIEIRLDGNMFLSRHTMDLKYTFIDSRIEDLVGYEPFELVGRAAYIFHNPVDAPKCYSCHQSLLQNGTAVSKYYRFLGKTGAWVWLQTRATIIYNKGNIPQYIVCMNYMIDEEEGRRYLMMEHEEPGVKAVDVDGFIDITAINSPSSSDNGYVSDLDHQSPGTISPGMVSPVGPVTSPKNASHQDNILGNMSFEDFIGPGAFLDDTFTPPRSLKDLSSDPVSSQPAVSPNYIMPSKFNSNISGVTSGKNVVKTNNTFESDMEIDLESGEKSITVTLQAGAHHQNQDLNTLLLKALKTLVPVQTQGVQPNIEISIEPSQATTSVRNAKPQIHINGQNNVTSLQSTSKNNVAPGSSMGASPLNIDSSCNTMLGTSPGNDAIMDFSIGKFTEGSVNQKINDTMGPFDLFTGSELMDSSSQFLDYDTLNLTDTNNIVGDTLTDNLLNDVSLGTTVDTVPLQSFSSTHASSRVQCTTASKPLVVSSTKAVHSQAKPQSSHKPQGSQYSTSCRNTVYQNKEGTVLHPGRNISTKKLSHSTNGTNTAHLKYSTNHKIDFEAAKRGLDDHSYTAKCPSRNNGHVKFATNLDKKRTRPEGTLLEHFLTTDKPLNPMRGSDCVAQSISQLKIDDNNSVKRTTKPTLLKKLLTEDKCETEKSSHNGVVRVNGTTSATAAAVAGSSNIITQNSDVIPPVFDEPAVTDLNMLTSGPDVDESAWNDVSKQDMDELYLSSEINEILEQENWLQEEWMKHFLEDVL